MTLILIELFRLLRSLQSLFLNKLIVSKTIVSVSIIVLFAFGTTTIHEKSMLPANAKFAIVALLAFGIEQFAGRRLREMEGCSFLTAAALQFRQRLAFRVALHVPFATIAFAALFGVRELGLPETGLSIIIWLVAALVAWTFTRGSGLPSRRASKMPSPMSLDRIQGEEGEDPAKSEPSTSLSALFARIRFGRRTPLTPLLLLAASLGATSILILAATQMSHSANHLIEQACLCALLSALFCSVPSGSCRFTGALGIPAAEVLSALSLPAAVAVCACTVTSLLLFGHEVALAAFSAGLLPILVLGYRALLFRRERRAIADRRMQLEILSLGLIGIAVPIAVPIVVILRMAHAVRVDRESRWLLG